MVKKYQALPADDQLSRVSRELRFHPSEPTQATTLSRDAVARFNREGYLAPLPVFDPAEANTIRSAFDDILERELANGGNAYSISTAHRHHGVVWDLLREPRILRYVTDLLGKDVVGWGSHFFCKLPGDEKIAAWHQDASYWPLTPSKTVTVWLAIDDADRDNACMQFIPQSHTQGHIEFRESGSEENNVLNQTVDDVERFGEAIHVELAAGEISIHSDLLLHGSPANTSRRRRCGLTLRYCAADVKAHLDWNDKGVIVSGTDLSGHWSNHGRPGEVSGPSRN
ncbi:MAG: phytanoyl-CoA dioxygenase family protein [Planctomycetota bacterium]